MDDGWEGVDGWMDGRVAGWMDELYLLYIKSYFVRKINQINFIVVEGCKHIQHLFTLIKSQF